jgi:peroxiredoxin
MRFVLADIIECRLDTVKDKLISGAVFLLAMALILIFASPSYRQGEPSMAGKPAPDFSFTLEGKPARLADLRGKVVVLNFWATWCPPCVEEMPSLNRLHAQIAVQGGLVLGISVDDSPEAYERFLQQHNITFPNYRDPAKRINATYGTFMYPETYIIARDGRIARKIIGPQNWQSSDLLAYLKRLLEGSGE